MTPSGQVCWICDGVGDTGDHKSKRTDLNAAFGVVTQQAPLYYNSATMKNRRVGSLDAKILKSLGRICAYCNNVRTQPHDRAWERMSHVLRELLATNRLGATVRGSSIFPHETARRMQDVQLYFIKVLGCHVAEKGLPLDLKSFASAIMQGTAHQRVYLRIGRGPSLNGNAIVGASDMEVFLHAADHSCAFATWLYNAGGISMNVMLASKGESRRDLDGAWHPAAGTNRLRVFDFTANRPQLYPQFENTLLGPRIE